MTKRAYTTPVATEGRDREGKPERVLLPKPIERRVSLFDPIGGRDNRVGHVDPDGSIWWGDPDLMTAKQVAAIRRRQYRAVYHGDEIVAVAVR